MRKLTLEEIKKSQFETLKILRDFCRENNLKYYLAFGTLLGAVRHKGFIPWDDDVDVFMPKDDYDYLVNHFIDKTANRRELISKDTCPEFYLDIAKIIDRNTVVVEKGQTLKIGVWIDIFPLDYLTENKSLIHRENIHIGLLSIPAKYAAIKPLKGRAAYKNFIARVINFILPSYEWINNKRKIHINRILSKSKTGMYGITYQNLGYYGVLYTPETTFEPSVSMEFEGELFDAPNDYHKILKCFYGKNYMMLPPLKKQISHHSNVCYWSEENDLLLE